MRRRRIQPLQPVIWRKGVKARVSSSRRKAQSPVWKVTVSTGLAPRSPHSALPTIHSIGDRHSRKNRGLIQRGFIRSIS